MKTKYIILLALLFAFKSECKAQVQHWDSAYLKHFVDSAGTIPPNVDLTTLHLKTATIKNGVIDKDNFYSIVAILISKIEEQNEEINQLNEIIELSGKAMDVQKQNIKMLIEMLPYEIRKQLKK